MISDHRKYGRYWFLAMCENQDGRHLTFLYVCYRYPLWTRYLKNCFTNRLQFRFMMSYHLKDGRYWFWAICLNQDGRHQTFEIYVLSKIMLVNAISLKPFPQSTSNLKFVFILSIRQVLLILGHLLKPKWPLSWFKKWLQFQVWTWYLKYHFINWL